MKYEEAAKELQSIPNLKTKDLDRFNKTLIKNGEDVEDLKNHVLEDQLVHRTYFQVSLAQKKNYVEQFEFIEEHSRLLQDWWHVDQLLQFIKGPVDFNYAYKKAKSYIKSNQVFLRRWGYVLLLLDYHKNPKYTKKMLSLLKDDDAYYVQMAEAWLISFLAIYNFNEVYHFFETTTISYSITGKAVQKICDSFRISNDNKEKVKKLREILKQNSLHPNDNKLRL